MKVLSVCLLIIAIALGQITCSSNQVYVKMTKKTGSWASEESWEIYDGATKIYTSPSLVNNQFRVIEQCLPTSTNNQYTIKLKDSYGDSWYSGCYLQIEGSEGNIFFRQVLFTSYEETASLSLYYAFTKQAEWRMTSGTVSGTWTEYNYADSSWNLVTLGSVTAAVSGTQYFRKTFTGVASMAAYELSMNYRYGIVAYINGVEIYRDNMPEGAVSSSTLANGSYPAVEYHTFIRPGQEVANSQSVLAVELHFLTAQGQSNVDFDAYLALNAPSMADSLCFNYPYNMTLSATAGSNIANIMDYSRSTSYSISASSLPVTINMGIESVHAFLNGVRIWPYSSPTTAVTGYTLQGSNTSSGTWTNVVTASGLVYTSNEFINSYGYFYTGLFKNYRFEATASATTGTMYIYEMQPLTCALALPTSIEFEQSTYSYYAKFDEVLIRPKVTEFTGCTINPTPAAGLEWDTTTCTLSGKVASASTTQYTMSVLLNGQSYTGSFTLQIIDCAGTLVNIQRTYQSSAVYEGFTIKDATSQATVLEVLPNSGQINSITTNSIVCLTSPKYTISTTSSSYNYWMSSSYLYVNAYLDDDEFETILRHRYDINLGLPTAVTFGVQYPVKSLESWHYKTAEVPTNWYGNDMSWPTATAGNFPSSTNQIQLYKKQFTVSSLTDIAGIVISLRYQYGVQIYLNNHEVFRKGFTGDLSTSTYSTTSLSTSIYRQISLPIKTMGDGTTTSVDYITTGNNVIAIALIAAGSTQTTADFDCAVRLMGSASEHRSFYHSYSSSYISGSTSAITAGYYGYNIYYSSCNTNYIYFTFNNDRHEWISSVILKLYYTQNTQQPRNVVIKAKNSEDSEWTTIKTVTDMTWSLVGQSKRIWLTNNKAYNQYRFENFATGSTTECYWKIGQIELRSDATNVVVPALSYTPSISIYKEIEMSEEYPNSEYYTEFTVTPALPQGIIMDPNTGVISGTAHTASTTTYTVSAKKFNTGETVTAQFSMAIDICTGGKSLITLMARSDSSPAQSSWKVYQGKGTTGTLVDSVTQLAVSSGENWADFCLNHGIYTLELLDTSSNGWSYPAGYYLSVDNQEMKFEMGQVYTGQTPTSVTKYFSSLLPFQIEYDDWKVYKDGSVADDWKTINFDDSTWTVTKAAEIGSVEAITTYIRREVNIPDIADYQVLNVRVKYCGGVVAYFNGRRVARFNLEDAFDEETESLANRQIGFSMFHIVLSTVGAVTGKNVIAFEIHRPLGSSSSEAVVFDATGVFGVNDCSIGVDSVINVSGTTGYTIGDLENFFDLTPVSYGYQSNAVGTYLQWTVENLEGTKFNSFALETIYSRTSWGFSVYGRENEYEDDDPDAEEYLTLYEGTNQSTIVRGRPAWDVPVGIAGFRQFRHEVDDTASSTVYISAYILQYCKAQGEGTCPGEGDYPPVAEGQISPAECEDGFSGYSYRVCTNGVLQPVQTDKCIYKLPAKLNYDAERYVVVMNTETNIPAPDYLNIITKFYLAENTFLPDGLELNEQTGAITGKATAESGLKTYTIYGENPTGTTMTTINISVRKGECKAEGNFPKTEVGQIAEYDCAVAGSYVGTQKRACVLGARDGEWQKIQGTCMPISMIVLLVIIGIIVLGIGGLFVMRATKKTKAVGGVKGKKSAKSTKSLSKKSSTKAVKV